MTEAARQAGENDLASMLAAAIMRSRATHSTMVERGGIEVREFRYENGLIEIAIYTPELAPGAGKVPRAVVTRMPAKRNWVVHIRAQRVWTGRSKRRALEFAVAEATSVGGKLKVADSVHPHSHIGGNA
jgi:hypothetical protein